MFILNLFYLSDILPLILVAVKREQEGEHLDIVFFNKRLIFQKKIVVL